MFIIDGMLSYGGVVPFLVKSNQTIGITYLGGIQIVEGRKMNVQVVFIGMECQEVFIGDRFPMTYVPVINVGMFLLGWSSRAEGVTAQIPGIPPK